LHPDRHVDGWPRELRLDLDVGHLEMPGERDMREDLHVPAGVLPRGMMLVPLLGDGGRGEGDQKRSEEPRGGSLHDHLLKLSWAGDSEGQVYGRRRMAASQPDYLPLGAGSSVS